MAYLDSIITEINSTLKGSLTAFPAAKLLGIAYSITKKSGQLTMTIPAIIDTKGIAKEISFDDVPELTIYHKVFASSYSIANKKQNYGDGYTEFNHNYDVDLIVMADRKRVGIQPDSFEAVIASNIPVTAKIQGIHFVTIYPISANHNSRSLFSQEYQGVQYFLKPEYIFFSIRYRVELWYTKGCLSLCQCD